MNLRGGNSVGGIGNAVRSVVRKLVISTLSILLLLSSFPAFAGSENSYTDSFNKAKRILEQQVYFDNRTTIYCSARFDEQGYIELPEGFAANKYQNRTQKIEWEHVVPAENFGRAFADWRDGNSKCTDNSGKSFKGRKCAEKVNVEYRYMQSDMYNLYPAIGAVNAARKNYNFTLLPGAQSSFGSCSMKIEGNKVEPPEAARGMIARTYKYMAQAYPQYKMSDQQTKLMDAWDKMYSVDAWECTRAKRIEVIQGNENPVVKSQCIEKQLWN